MRSIVLSAAFTVAYITSVAQIGQITVVEHFTNSNCGICASVNPGAYSTMANFGNIHIAFHPSSPYPSCFFSMQNAVENDARTNYYNIYGGTPRFVVNGMPIANVSQLNSTLSTSQGLLTNYGVRATQEYVAADSVAVRVVITKVAADTTTAATLFVGAMQDTVAQTTGNGESIHRDVFRKALSTTVGDVVVLPANIGDSIVSTYSYKVLSSWIAARMNTVAILQNTATRRAINAAKSTNIATIVTPPAALASKSESVNHAYPVPCRDILNLQNWLNHNTYSVHTIQGQIALSERIVSPTISVASLPTGNYILLLNGSQGTVLQRISVVR
jgi:hypothetical protein